MKRIQLLLLVSILGLYGCNSSQKEASEHAEDEHGSGHSEESFERGPHGGRLLEKDGLALEVTIFESGVPPQFRVYAYEERKPVSPGEVDLKMELHRLGGRTDAFRFAGESDYLKGDQVVEEPHSFDVKVIASRKGKNYEWEYSQVEGRVELSEDQIKGSGIEVKTAGPATITSTLSLPGEITLNLDRVAHVVPGVDGIASDVRKNLGDPVKAGEVIAVLKSRELANLKSEYLSAQERVILAKATFERESALWNKKITPEQDYLNSKQALAEAEIELEAAEQKLLAMGIDRGEVKGLSRGDSAQMNLYPIRAPFSGVVIQKHVSIGEAVRQEDEIFEIADLSMVWVEVTVYAKDLNLVRTGQTVTVRAESLNLQQEGTLAYVGPLVGEQTRSAKARVVLPNENGQWRPGLFVTVEILQEESEVPLAVEAEAIQSYRDWDVVFVRYGDFFEAWPLELGRKDKQFVEVLSGLSPGTQYAARNSFVLKADLGKAGASHEH